jgi:hypothetical protein
MDTGLEGIFSDVRTHLNGIYKFQESRPGLYVFNTDNPDPNFLEILKQSGIGPEKIQAKLGEYRSNDIGGTCVYTGGRGGFDYVVILPSGNASYGDWALRIGEETNHGEHGTEHDGSNKYVKIFSPVAREFMGGSGRCHIARKVCVIPPGKMLPDGFPASMAKYDDTTDTFSFDVAHAVGYELARESIVGENAWHSAMFHAKNESALWGLYNDVLVPDIRIKVPPALENKDGLIADMEGHIKSIGLKHRIGFVIDENDTRGMNR